MDTKKLSLNQKNILNLFEKEQYLSVGKIAKALNIPHPTAKQSLNRLLDYNMVERHGVGKGSYYARKDENVVLDTLGNKIVTVYSGKTAFTNLFNNIEKSLGKDDYYLSFAFKEEYQEISMTEFFVDFHYKLTQKGVVDKTIVSNDVKDSVLLAYRNVPKLQIRFNDQELPTGMSILKDRVINLVWGKEPVAIEICSPVIVERYHDFFESLWKKSI